MSLCYARRGLFLMRMHVFGDPAALFADQLTDDAAGIEPGFSRAAAHTVAGTDQFKTAIKNTVRQYGQLIRLLID